MQKQGVEFAVVKDQNKTIQKIGKSSILQPKTNYSGKGSTKWFDDSKLIKTNRK